MAAMKIGFGKNPITPPVGTELAGYAGYRPCTGIHDPLYCKAVVLEQNSVRYGLVVLDLMCVDETLYREIGHQLQPLGISQDRLLVSAIHTHAAPRGMILGAGPLDKVNREGLVDRHAFGDYMESVVRTVTETCTQAVQSLESFRVRTAKGPVPEVGSERHTGMAPDGEMTVLQFETQSRKNLLIYNFPCHPTVTNAANLLVSTDFVANIEELLAADMAVFVNGAAGDISTRYTRRESSFAECARMGTIAAEQIRSVIEQEAYQEPTPLMGVHKIISLEARPVPSLAEAQAQMEAHTRRLTEAEAAGEAPAALRILKSYVEGAGVNLEFAETMKGIRHLHLPVTVFRFCGMDFVSVPGELFSALKPENLSVFGYTNGYFRYICGEESYDAGYYEAMAAILARGQGEVFVSNIIALLRQLEK